MTFKTIALRACKDTAQTIIETPCMADLLLPRIDRVERRWNIQGATDAEMLRIQREHGQWLYNLSRKHDSLYPDRLTYLHR